MLANLKDIQLRIGPPPTASLDPGDSTVEMETRTGKTYVYLRTIFELNKRYGFTKFIIVVPSVATEDHLCKSVQAVMPSAFVQAPPATKCWRCSRQMTDDGFRAACSVTPFAQFLDDSAKLRQVRNFAASPQIQIMVVTVGTINTKDANNLYKDSEKTGGEKPIDLIRLTRSIGIVDEPQRVDGGLAGRGKEALVAMNPLRTLR